MTTAVFRRKLIALCCILSVLGSLGAEPCALFAAASSVSSMETVGASAEAAGASVETVGASVEDEAAGPGAAVSPSESTAPVSTVTPMPGMSAVPGASGVSGNNSGVSGNNSGVSGNGSVSDNGISANPGNPGITAMETENTPAPVNPYEDWTGQQDSSADLEGLTNELSGVRFETDGLPLTDRGELPSLSFEGYDPAGVPVSNVYLLAAATGEHAGDGISFFTVDYADADGNECREYVYPEKSEESDEILSTNGLPVSDGAREYLQALTGYQLAGDGCGLEAYGTAEYLFRTDAAIREIRRIGVYYEKSGTWSCEELRLYRVDKLAGRQHVGMLSGDLFYAFSGEMLAASAQSEEISWTKDGDCSFSVSDGPDYQLLLCEKEEFSAYDSRYENRYALRIDFSDVSGAGLDSLRNYYAGEERTLSQMDLCEGMSLEILYEDCYGILRKVNIPVTLASLLWGTSTGSIGDAHLSEIAPQGASLGFAGTFPGFTNLVEAKLLVGAGTAEDSTGLYMEDPSERYERRLRESRTDSIRVDCFAWYDASHAQPLTLSVSGALPVYAFSGIPAYAYTAPDASGKEIASGEGFLIPFLPHEGGDDLSLYEEAERYLVTMHTAEDLGADTDLDIYLRLSYADNSGNLEKTPVVSVRECAERYYGLWEGNTSDHFAYRLGTSRGQDLCFVVYAPDVRYFTQLEAILGAGGDASDQWLVKGIEIQRLDYLGPRQTVWEETNAAGYESDRKVFRDHFGETMVSLPSAELTVSCAETAVLKFPRPETAPEARGPIGALSYEECLGGLGFADATASYAVAVKVAGSEDCGSKEDFYFQLLFADGTSGYVHANSLLPAGTFRDGEEEHFRISVNRGLGELCGIRIAADPAGEETFDRLCIEQIAVIEESESFLGRSFLFENIGWIGSGEEGPVTFPVTGSGNSVNLLFAVSTAPDTALDTSAYYGSLAEGSLEAALEYIDTYGERKTAVLDVVRAMKEYKSPSEETFAGDVLTVSSGISLDTASGRLLLRNHTDRFYWKLWDVSSLLNVTFRAKSAEAVNWNVGSLSVSLAAGDGVLYRNGNGESVRETALKYLCCADAVTSPAYRIETSPGTSGSFTAVFTENSIKTGERAGEYVEVESTAAPSEGDTVTLCLYPAASSLTGEETVLPPASAVLSYTDICGITHEAFSGELALTGEQVYTCEMKTSLLSTMDRLSVSSENGKFLLIDHAVAFLMRGGRAVRTMYFDLGGRNAAEGIAVSPETSSGKVRTAQKVYLQTEEGMQPLDLSEDGDLLVSLMYRPAEGTSEEVRSAPVSLKSLGTLAIRGGQLLTLDFGEEYLGEVTGICFENTARGELRIEAAAVSMLRGDLLSGEDRIHDWASFANGGALWEGEGILRPTGQGLGDPQAVVPLYLEFETAEAGNALESGCADAVRMEIRFDGYGGRTQYIRDLRNYISEGPGYFEAGERVSASLLVTGGSSLKSMYLEPYDSNASRTAGWNLAKVSVRAGEESMPLWRLIGERILEGTGRQITLADLSVTVGATAYNSSTRRSVSVQATGGTETMEVSSGDSIRITSSVSGGSGSADVKVYGVYSGNEVSLEYYLSRSGSELLFNPPRNYGSDAVHYRIVASATDAPDLKAVIELYVTGEGITAAGPGSSGISPDVSGNNTGTTTGINIGTIPSSGTTPGSGGSTPSSQENGPGSGGIAPGN